MKFSYIFYILDLNTGFYAKSQRMYLKLKCLTTHLLLTKFPYARA